ncbi:hypothetical protein [Halosimplex pelagicum]|uniref:Uncharacterized protein n=1 Tax=Halosimplex pelagicum TaxID=869886 RepID=A0A7D5T6J1_9EURY|nr:hypothetical protein [Halosimplex pelagicum]QLH83388.1 hypothetical protein HZS54_17895 [Halosimplex pelagicum]
MIATYGLDPVVSVRGGENTPYHRSRSSQAELLKRLAGDAVEKAIAEEGLRPERVVLKTRYRRGGREPHTAYGLAEVYDRRELEETASAPGGVDG